MTGHMKLYSTIVAGDITADKLLAMAVEAEAALEPQQPGTPHEGNYQLRMVAQRALTAAEHMQKVGLASAKHVGCFSTFAVARGDMVRIKKGARRRSTNPKLRGVGDIVPRDFSVTVHDAYSGFACPHGNEPLKNPTIHWAGTGGYWYWVDANDVELVTQVANVA